MTAETDADVYRVARLELSRIAHPVAIAKHHGSRTTRLVRESRQFSVSLLHDSQQDLAAAAGRSAAGPDKFATLRIPVAEAPKGLSARAVAGSIAILWCRVVRSVETGEHLVFIGEESPEGYPT